MAEQQKTPSWFHPDYPPINTQDDVGKAVVAGQAVEYPQVVRNMVDPPVIGQIFGNLSFMLFKKPRMFRDKPIYGYVKLRGNHQDDKSARFDAYRIVREVDSKFQVRIAQVGTWVPITDNDGVVKELYDVREGDEEIHIRDEAVKERESEARRITRELQEAEEALKTGDDIYDKPESLDFYTMKRVTEMRVAEAVQIQQRKLDELRKTLVETHMILHRLEIPNPQYSSEWVDNYNRERAKTSLPDFVPGGKQFAAYDSTTLGGLEEDFPEIVETVTKKMGTYGKSADDESADSESTLQGPDDRIGKHV